MAENQPIKKVPVKRSHEDSLLDCLLIYCKMQNKPLSKHAATAGLPLEHDRLTPNLFIRAAKRAGFTAKMSCQPLQQISKLALPAVLILENQKACLLIKFKSSQIAVIITPEAGSGASEVKLADLKQEYTGHVIFIKPEFNFSARSEETLHSDQSKHWFWSVLLKSWPEYSHILLASFLINLFALATPLFVMNVYDRVVPNYAIDTLWVLAIGVGLVFTFDFIMKNLRGYFIDIAGKQIDIRLSSLIFERILDLKMAARPQSVGAFANTVTAFESFRDFITSSTIAVLIDLPFVFIFIAIIGVIAGNLFLIPLIAVPVIIIIGLILQAPLIRLTKESYKHAAEKQATLIESMYGAEAIKVARAESSMQQRWETIIAAASRVGTKLRFFGNLGVNFSLFSQQIATVALVIFGVYKISEGEITVGALIACTILTGRALAPMSQVASLLSRYYQSVNALQGLDRVMELPVDRPHGKSPLQRPGFKGDILLKDVTFTYPNSEIASLNSLNIHIKSGEHIGFIGRIGSGKTTIAKLMLGLYEPTEGQIYLDNTDIKQLDPADLRHHIGYVPQDITLFYGTIRDNITLGARYVDDSEILRAAALSGVSHFVQSNPQGFDLQVGERGSYLSGGQRQSVSIARALLLRPPMLVMDEPTHAMDDKSEAQLRASISPILPGRTLLVFTHKASMLSLVDRLIVLEQGKIVADGPKDEIIKSLNEGKIKVKKP